MPATASPASRPQRLRSVARPINADARPRGLARAAHVKVTVGMTVDFPLAAEVEAGDLWIADWPTAIIRQERFDCFSLAERNFRLVLQKGPRWAVH